MNKEQKWLMVDVESGKYVRDIELSRDGKLNKIEWVSVTSNPKFAKQFSEKQIKKANRIFNANTNKKIFWPQEKPRSNTALITACVIIYVAVLFCLIMLARDLKNKQNQIEVYEQHIENLITEKATHTTAIYQETLTLINAACYLDYDYSYEIAKNALEASKKYDVPVFVIYALIMTESRGVVSAHNSFGATGLMQLTQPAIDEYNRLNDSNFTLSDAYDIGIAIEIGVWFFKYAAKFISEPYIYDYYTDCYIVYNCGPSGYRNLPENYKNPPKSFKNYYFECLRDIGPF